MGYSLGGRLAVHALIDNPSVWQGAIIISSHPGLASKEERAERIAGDQRWAGRFLQEPWGSLLEDWDKQSIFNSSPRRERTEEEFSRKNLSHALQEWSIAKQADLRGKIEELSVPILWMVGEKDVKYRSLAQEVRLKNPLSCVKVVPNAGHRIPWDCPEIFCSYLNAFLKLI